MGLVFYEDPFPHVVCKNWFTEEEMKKIWVELDYYSTVDNLVPPERSGTAWHNDNTPKKNNLAKFLNETYYNIDDSIILRLNRKLFSEEVLEQCDKHWGLSSLRSSDYDTTLLSYYEDSHHYKPHRDLVMLTALTHFWKEPKRFEGGELYFPNFENFHYECEHNKMILFPSEVMHGVTPVSIPDEYKGKWMGRWTMSQFIKYSSNT